MGQFKPMVKMYTDEPSVVLKLKKGGKVHHKHHKHHEEHGHKSMHHAAGGSMHGAHHAFEAEHGKSPKKPSISARRHAMNPQMYKKGGKVAHKLDGGGMPMGAPMAAPMAARPAMGAAPMAAMGRPALGQMDPRARMARAAQVRRALTGMKKGGSAGMEKHIAKLEKELHHHEAMSASKAHHHKHGGIHHKASGGEIDAAETKTTIKDSVKPYAKTKVDDGQRHDKAHGTGEVKESKPGGYKHGGKVHHMSGHSEDSYEHHKAMEKHYSAKCKEGGSAHMHKMMEHHKHMAKMCKGGKYAMGGTIEGNEGKFENTKVNDGDHNDPAHGTGGVRMGNAGGFKKGGKAHHKHMAHHKHGGKHHFADGGHVPGLSSATIEGGNWENRPANSAKPGVKNTTTGEVKESNAGGYKRGGAAKKAYATGGNVVDDGKAEKMPRHFISQPVANSLQSGTFKRGGKVRKGRAYGGSC
jgi:hypothetical protein